MEAIQKFTFKKGTIDFDLSKENIMINASEMAKLFDKKVENFMKTDHAKAFISAFNNPPNGGLLGVNSEEDLFQFRGRNGMWMNRILAIKFAAWLDVEFEVWIYVTIDRLMFGDLRYMLSERAKLNQELMHKKKQHLENSEEYREILALEQKAKSMKNNIANFSSSQYQLFLKGNNDN